MAATVEVTAGVTRLLVGGCHEVVGFGGEKCQSWQIIHAEVAGVLDDSLFVAVGSLERDVVPGSFFGFVLPNRNFYSVQAACEYWFIGHNVFSFLKVVCFSFTKRRQPVENKQPSKRKASPVVPSEAKDSAALAGP